MKHNFLTESALSTMAEDDLGSMETNRWVLFGNKIPKEEIVYFCQVVIVYVVVITSIVNLSLENGSSELWISLLSSAIGYILPNPSLRKS